MGKYFNESILVTIITVTYNSSPLLEKTIKSLLEQPIKNYEYIIIDGNSSDGTKNILKKYEDKIDFYISEPDNGIYDAMNKGIKYAHGRYIYFLNSGDYLHKDILKILNPILKKSNVEFLYGNVNYGNINKRYDGEFNKIKIMYKNICQQAIFYHRSIFTMIGLFDCRYGILADWHFNFKIFAAENIRKKYVDITISYYDNNGISSRKEDLLFIKNKREIIRKNFGFLYMILYCFDCFMMKTKSMVKKIEYSMKNSVTKI